MQDNEPNLQSNPAKAFAARVGVLCVGGLLVYAALPAPLEYSTWWDGTSHVPFILGVLVFALGIAAPNRWCEALVTFVP